MTPKFVVTYPVALVASVVVLCFGAVVVVAVSKGQDLQTVIGVLGVFAATIGGIFAHRNVTPLAQPKDADGKVLTPNL